MPSHVTLTSLEFVVPHPLVANLLRYPDPLSEALTMIVYLNLLLSLFPSMLGPWNTVLRNSGELAGRAPPHAMRPPRRAPFTWLARHEDVHVPSHAIGITESRSND